MDRRLFYFQWPGLLFAFLAAAVVVPAVHAQLLDLSDLPLGVQADTDPNLVVTLDDSGSMASAYLPYEVLTLSRNRRFRSPHVNKLYYDPKVSYLPPSNAQGMQEPDAQFDAAIRGYYNRSGSARLTRDLNSEFAAVFSHDQGWRPNELDEGWLASGCDAELCNRQGAYYYEFHGSDRVDPLCDGAATNESCYRKIVISDPLEYSQSGGRNRYGRTLAEEQTNFANWYQFYVTRADAAKTATLRAFTPDNVPDNVRLGRQTINQYSNVDPIRSGSPSNGGRAGVAPLDANSREGFYQWLRQIGTNGSTPLRRAVYRAGEFFKTDAAYLSDPADPGSELVGCRVNSHILVTDGFYNGSFITPANFQKDQDSHNLPDGRVYNPKASPVYRNKKDSKSLADLAFHYWSSDLHAAPNELQPFWSSAPGVPSQDPWHPKNDPATWQHMNSFAISFGVEGTVPTDEPTLQQLIDGNREWPRTRFGSTTIDDLYHSAINGRGDFFSAGNPQELVDALKAITDRLGERKGSAPSLGATSGRISSGSNIFIASFDIESWSGDLQAFEISDGSGFGDVQATGCNSRPIGSRCSSTPEWSAAQRNEFGDAHIAANQRRLLSYNPELGNVGSRGIVFDWSANLSATQRQQLNRGDHLGEMRLNYLRGDSSGELPSGPFRQRSAPEGGALNRVGPFMHSNIVYVGTGDDRRQFRFPDDLESAAYSMGTSSRPAMVYVGGNDGMLHAYYANGNHKGREAWAYVPNAVFSNLHWLTNPAFTAMSFVDGQLDYQDAFINGRWRSLLAGGLRKGGQGYFMLDVTSPPDGSQFDPNTNVMWEFTDQADVDLGYTYGKPAIVKSNYNNGEWVVLLPSGYNSTEADGDQGSGQAYLFVLAADDGELIAKLKAGSSSASSPNGLSSPTAVSDSDVDNFGKGARGTDIDTWVADYAYAGDLLGRLWKFDLSSTNPADWEALLLYDAGSDQPITAAPAVGSVPAIGTQDGFKESRYVYVGTGQYLTPGDTNNTRAQRFYAIIDDDRCSNQTGACVSDSQLLSQSISSQGVLSTRSFSPGSHKGCQLELADQASGERVIHKASVIADNLIFSSLTPDGSACSSTVQGALYALNRYTCGQTAGQVLDTNGDGLIDSADMVNDVPQSRIVTSGGGFYQAFDGPNSGAIGGPQGFIPADYGERKGRVRWRQLK